jgi:hypothetical protein
MKKRLEAELLSIAHRILKLKNKSEVDQLYHETQKLYEALSVLKFYGDNYEQVKSDVSLDDLEEKLSASLEEKDPEETISSKPVILEEPKEEVVQEIEIEEKIEETEIVAEEEPILAETKTEEPTEEPIIEAKSETDFEHLFELAADNPESKEEIEEKIQEPKQISFDELLGENYTEPVFVKPNSLTLSTSKKEKEEEEVDVAIDKVDEKPLSLNDKLSKTINIGLNDRIGFVKYLFGESNEDYNRVLSQLNTFSSFEEAKDFIEEIIKPDYDNWKGADDYAERFIEIVEKKFL